MGRTTVLEQYQRLEAEGVWRPDAEAQRRDVIVSIGEATLILSDPNERILTHWSLPAVTCLNPGEAPAIYGPGADAPDTLEVADPEMIEALDRVSKAIRRGQAHPGRLRASIFGGATALILVILVFWLPGALTRYTTALLPDVARASIGADVLDQVKRVSGQPCESPSGVRALARLNDRLFPDVERQLVVLPSALTGTAHLPGGILLIDHRLVEDVDSPQVVALALVAENARYMAGDPVEALLGELGVRASLRLLTTGELTTEPLARYAEVLVARVPTDTVLPDVDAGVEDILTDSNWIALQQICEG